MFIDTFKFDSCKNIFLKDKDVIPKKSYRNPCLHFLTHYLTLLAFKTSLP